MIGLGKDVLKKIQNLLIQIDQQPIAKKKISKINQGVQKYQHLKIDLPSPPSKISDYYNFDRKNTQNKQNICSTRIEKLYSDHFVKQQRRLNKNASILIEELRKNTQFKVQNKTSQFIVHKKNLKPIHQRTDEILMNRQRSIDKIKQNLPKSKQKLDLQQLQQAQRIRQSILKNYSKLEISQIIQNMENRNMKRLQKIQNQKINTISLKLKEVKDKPIISNDSKNLFQKHLLKKNLSKNVFQRFQQYHCQKKKNWEQYLNRRRQEETPFTPKINVTSRIIAERSRSKRQQLIKMSRSHSCKCLSSSARRGNSQSNISSTFIVEKSPNRSINKHSNSITTANTSQRALNKQSLQR